MENRSFKKSKLKDFLRRKSVKREETKKREMNMGPTFTLISQKDIRDLQEHNTPLSMRKIQKNFNYVR